MSGMAIEVAGLTKRYRGAPVVDGLDFSVHAGTVTAFLGPNGAGKTTTIRALLGLIRPDEGTALVLGQPFRDLPRPAQAVGVLIDGAGFDPRRTAEHHLRIIAAASGVPARRVDAVLGATDLSDAAGKKVGTFSLWMRQRLGLATALLGDPELLVLDEPANGLDPAGMHWLRGFLREYATRGRTVFVSSHVLSEVALFSDNVIVINRGRLVEQTTVTALMADAVISVRTPAPAELTAVLLAHGADVRARDDDRLTLTGTTVEQVGTLAAAHHIVLYELISQQRALEDVFLELTATGGTT